MARLAKSLEVLRSQIDALAPDRDKSSDGWIGDAAHAARKSDHNPDPEDVVRALDITNDPSHGVVAANLAEQLRQSKDPRLKYVISNRRIAEAAKGWEWAPYSGSNPHDKHFHTSVVADDVLADDTSPWKLTLSAIDPHAPSVTAPSGPSLGLQIRKGSSGPDVAKAQALLGFVTQDGKFGSVTEKAVKEFQQKHGLKVDGIVGPETWPVLIASPNPLNSIVSAVGNAFDAKAPKIVADLMRDFTLTDLQAAGILGNIGHECGGFTLMQEESPVGGGAGGYGWCQWTGPRRASFFQWCQQNNLSVDSDEGNYGYLKYELTETAEKAAIAAVKATSTLHDAMVAFEQAFERAGVKNYPSRDAYAARALAAYQASLVAPKPSPITVPGVVVPPPLPAQPAPHLDVQTIQQTLQTLHATVQALQPVIHLGVQYGPAIAGMLAKLPSVAGSAKSDPSVFIQRVIAALAVLTGMPAPAPPAQASGANTASTVTGIAGLGLTTFLQLLGTVGAPHITTTGAALTTVFGVLSALGVSKTAGSVVGSLANALLSHANPK